MQSCRLPRCYQPVTAPDHVAGYRGLSCGLKKKATGNSETRGGPMSKEAAEHHRKAAEHHKHAARHHEEAATHHDAGSHDKAAITRIPPTGTNYTRRITPAKPPKHTPTSTAPDRCRADIEVLVTTGTSPIPCQSPSTRRPSPAASRSARRAPRSSSSCSASCR
jgi:hypothetical protein